VTFVDNKLIIALLQTISNCHFAMSDSTAPTRIKFRCAPFLPQWLAHQARVLGEAMQPELSIVHYKGFGKTLDIRAQPLVGCTMGVASAAADSVTVRTDTDPTVSSPAVSSGKIGGAVTGVTFNVAAGDRVAARAGVEATFTFTPSAGGGGPSDVTLNYPSGFFATSATPTAKASTAGVTLTPRAPGSTSFVLAAAGGTLVA
jgi:hypothetical protein